MSLDNLLNTIHSLSAFDAEKEQLEIVEENKERLVQLQQEQLAAGIGKDGRKRIDEYRPFTKFIKKTKGVGLGRVTDRVTFFMTGNLYGSLEAKLNGSLFSIESPLPTFDKMVERITPDDYGLDYDQRLEFATEIVLPQIQERFKQKVSF